MTPSSVARDDSGEAVRPSGNIGAAPLYGRPGRTTGVPEPVRARKAVERDRSLHPSTPGRSASETPLTQVGPP
jgi:hypothetical protein